MKSLFPYISSFRQRATALFHRTDPVEAASSARRQRSTQVFTEHHKPLEPQKDSEKTTLPQA
jgi:hypothetical protein